MEKQTLFLLISELKEAIFRTIEAAGESAPLDAAHFADVAWDRVEARALAIDAAISVARHFSGRPS
jgi:hypothetical protein